MKLKNMSIDNIPFSEKKKKFEVQMLINRYNNIHAKTPR